jgi:hypothetical protein
MNQACSVNLSEAPWRAAMLEEMEAIKNNETWELITLPAVGHSAIGLKWVYKVKRNEADDAM